MCLELQEQKERMIEHWVDMLDNDTDSRTLVYQIFGESHDYYRHCKEDWHDEDIEMSAFDYLIEWDYEGMSYDQKNCLERYAESRGK